MYRRWNLRCSIWCETIGRALQRVCGSAAGLTRGREKTFKKDTQNQHLRLLIERQYFAFDFLVITGFTCHGTPNAEVIADAGHFSLHTALAVAHGLCASSSRELHRHLTALLFICRSFALLLLVPCTYLISFLRPFHTLFLSPFHSRSLSFYRERRSIHIFAQCKSFAYCMYETYANFRKVSFLLGRR